VAFLLRQVDPWDRPLLLRFLEEHCRKAADLAALREIRAYQQSQLPRKTRSDLSMRRSSAAVVPLDTWVEV
jgi:hypothetical protein